MPDPAVEQNLIAGLWTVAVVCSIWSWGPLGVAFLIGTGYENGGSEDPVAIEPDGTDTEYARLFAWICGRGYEPVGPGFMRLFFYYWHWVYRTRVWAFRSPAAGQYFFIQEPSFPLTGYYQVYFATCWADGGVLLTTGGATYTSGVDIFLSVGWRTENPVELEERHRETTERLKREGRRPEPDLSLAILLRTTHAMARKTRSPGSLAYLVTLGVLVFWQVGLVAATVWATGAWHWAPPVVAVAVVGWLRSFGLAVQYRRGRELIRRVRQERYPAEDANSGDEGV
ncbi:MAG: hypothetical protein JWO38_1541 [Gemmataceae bacterium]|nr:hypothetical protein [Gemmataceae bacterium]